MTLFVSELWHYPLKSAQGESLSGASWSGFGLADDITNAVVDEEIIVDKKIYHTIYELKNGQINGKGIYYNEDGSIERILYFKNLFIKK